MNRRLVLPVLLTGATALVSLALWRRLRRRRNHKDQDKNSKTTGPPLLPRRRFGRLDASLTVIGFPSVALARMPAQEQAAANEAVRHAVEELGITYARCERAPSPPRTRPLWMGRHHPLGGR